ncbi:MAG: hypothetical protein NC131_21225 [Roseburia sp.]|nr:hypothetical protein [Roseburia sp.]
MATVSFDEKVVVTDPDMVAKMRADLDSQSPVAQKRNVVTPEFDMAVAEENAKEWLETIKQSL